MVCKNRIIYGVVGLSWVLITYNICPPVLSLVIDLCCRPWHCPMRLRVPRLRFFN